MSLGNPLTHTDALSHFYALTPSQSKDLARKAAEVDWQLLDRLVGEPGVVEDPLPMSWAWLRPGPVEDWVGTRDMTRLVSPAVREVLESRLGARDTIQWLDASVTMPDGSSLPYFVMHFPYWDQDLYDPVATTWGPSGLPIRWVLSRAKLHGHNVFTLPKINDVVIVTGDVLAALREAGLSGIAAAPARVG